jgi:pyruvate ferredoxin oxidoreductase beta subunit/phenylglyoxylate dehydrogenase beta subunit
MVAKLEKAKEVKDGMAYIHVYNPCSTGWGYDPSKSIEYSRLSVQSRFFPLYEVEHGKFRITKDIRKPVPVANFVKDLKKFRHLSEEDIAELQALTDSRWNRILRLCSES